MAKINTLFICPKCEEGITASVRPEVCPSCGHKFPPPGFSGFSPPTTITEQSERLLDKVSHCNFILSLPREQCENMLNDAFDIIRTISAKKLKQSDIRNIVQLGIRIGKVAQRYEDFLAEGGVHSPQDTIIINEVINEQQQNADGDKAATPEPAPLFLPVEKDQ